MIDSLGGLGPTRPVYDVERDVANFSEAKTADIEAGRRQSDDQLRAAGGVVLSPLSHVLLEHFAAAHVRLGAASIVHGAEDERVQATTCARKLVEYIGALEAVILHHYSTEEGDSPRVALGLCASMIASIADQVPDVGQSVAQRNGVETMRNLIDRLRRTESSMASIEALHTDGVKADPVKLPILGGG
jgi:hypothetical protein